MTCLFSPVKRQGTVFELQHHQPKKLSKKEQALVEERKRLSNLYGMNTEASFPLTKKKRRKKKRARPGTAPAGSGRRSLKGSSLAGTKNKGQQRGRARSASRSSNSTWNKRREG